MIRTVTNNLRNGLKRNISLIPRYQSRILATPRFFTTTNLCLNEQKKDNEGWQKIGQIEQDKPRYSLTFTCKKCTTRSSHEISKQAYHNGTVLIQCPGCKNRHLIADHLKIFSDQRITLEDILESKGDVLSKGSINQQDLEGTQDLEWEEVPKAIAEKMEKNSD